MREANHFFKKNSISWPDLLGRAWDGRQDRDDLSGFYTVVCSLREAAEKGRRLKACAVRVCSRAAPRCLGERSALAAGGRLLVLRQQHHGAQLIRRIITSKRITAAVSRDSHHRYPSQHNQIGTPNIPRHFSECGRRIILSKKIPYPCTQQ